MKEYYICRYNLNARHSFTNERSRIHNHTFHIELYVKRRPAEVNITNSETEVKKNLEVIAGDSVISDINQVDKCIKQFLRPLQGAYLNEEELFKESANTLEKIGDRCFEIIKDLLGNTQFELSQLNISENPLFVYQVMDEINLPIINMENTISNYDMIKKQQELIRS